MKFDIKIIFDDINDAISTNLVLEQVHNTLNSYYKYEFIDIYEDNRDYVLHYKIYPKDYIDDSIEIENEISEQDF